MLSYICTASNRPEYLQLCSSVVRKPSFKYEERITGNVLFTISNSSRLTAALSTGALSHSEFSESTRINPTLQPPCWRRSPKCQRFLQACGQPERRPSDTLAWLCSNCCSCYRSRSIALLPGLSFHARPIAIIITLPPLTADLLNKTSTFLLAHHLPPAPKSAGTGPSSSVFEIW